MIEGLKVVGSGHSDFFELAIVRMPWERLGRYAPF